MRSTELFKENIKILKPKVTQRVAANDPARKALHKTMTGLLEDILDEDSSITDISAVRSSPYADALIKKVHEYFSMPHDVKWQAEGDKITWADIKKKSPNYVIIQGQDGTGAIKWNGGAGNWEVVLSGKEGVKIYSDSSINNLFREIKGTIGKITGYWSAIGVGAGSTNLSGYSKVSTNREGPVEKKRAMRKAARTIKNPTTLDPNASESQNIQAVMLKLRPVYIKYVAQAIADIKGVIGMSLKNDAYDKVKRKMEILNYLKNIRDELLDNPKVIPERLKDKLRPALYLTSSYYYPDETGEFTLGTGYRSRTPSKTSGQRKVISDIANGDTKKLTTLMNYLKQALLHP